MDTERYMPRVTGGRWALSRQIGAQWVCLIQDTTVDNLTDVALVLWALGIPLRRRNFRRYFPARRKGRCPTLALLELFAKLGQGTGKEVGV